MKRTISCAAFLVLSSYMVSAQTELSIADVINYSLEHKSDAVKARLDIENSEYKIEEVRANALPQINANGALTHNPILQQMALNMGGQTMVIKMGQPWQSTATVQLDQQIFNMSVFQGLKAAKSTREFYRINAHLTEEQIVEKVVGGYYDILKTESQIKTIDNTINNTTRIRNVLSSLFDNGLAKKIDLDRMNVTLNNLASSKQQLVNAVKLQENALKYFIGMDISHPIVLVDTAFSDGDFVMHERPTSIDNRTEVKLLEQQGELLQLNKKAIEAQRYPSLGLTANYGYMGLGEQFPYFAGTEQGVNWSNFASVGLNLRVPIFTGFSTRSKVSQAQIEIEKFEADFKDTKLALSLELENAYNQIQNALITMYNQKDNMELAQSVLKDVENNYNNGLATLTDLLNAENSYADAQNNYTNARMDYKVAEIQLIKAKGELKTYYSQNK